MISHEEAVKRIYERNDNIIITGEFKGWREPLSAICKTCGKPRNSCARAYYEINKKTGKVRNCNNCQSKERGIKSRKTNDEFIEEMNEKHPTIKIRGKYRTSEDPVECECLIDGYIWNPKPHSLSGGHGCPECVRRIQNLRTHDEYVKDLSVVKPFIEVVGEFKNLDTRIDFKCKICSYEWVGWPSPMLHNDVYGCPRCSGHIKVTEEEMIRRLKECNPTITYIEGYINMLEHAKYFCTICNNYWWTPPNSVLHDRGCPNCKMSRGEYKISNWLKEHDIEFESQFRFDDCKFERALPFDFYIKNKNICIEYDGIQHFEPTGFTKTISEEDILKNFNDLQIRDNIKNNYCEYNNIELKRIPYWEYDNIDNILTEIFA